MKKINSLLIVAILLSIGACSDKPSSGASASSFSEQTTAEAKQRKHSEYLAYEHSISVKLANNELEATFRKVVAFCADDTSFQCTMLHSNLNTGYYASGELELRILPAGVEPVLALVSRQGDVSNLSIEIDDLQEAIVNGEKRLEMLVQYQSRLMELEKQTSNDLESLMRMAEELSRVQSDIEYAQGAKAKLLQRTKMDIVHINLHSNYEISFWSPISDALSEFTNNLSEGIAAAITVIAYLLPWVIVLFVLIYVIRIIWRRTRLNK